MTCPKPNEYKYTITNAIGKKVTKTFSVPLSLTCAVNTQEGHIYTHLPIRISQNINGKTFCVKNRYRYKWTISLTRHVLNGNTVYMIDSNAKLPPNQDQYLMRIIPYDNPDPSRIKTDPNFTKPEVVEYGKKYYLTFASPEQVLSVGPTFSKVRTKKACSGNKHFSVKTQNWT